MSDGGKRLPPITRRGLLVGGVALGGGVLSLISPPPAARLRPPGALDEPDFTRRCIRCLRCAEVCPPGAIRFATSFGMAGSDTPYIEARSRPCTLCMRCTQVCPSGALAPIDADRTVVGAKVRMGHPRLDRQKCIAWQESGECRACYYVCPYAGAAVRLDGRQLGPVFDREACVGCGQCEEACPEAALAITIDPRNGAPS
jgi:MauM/NapG family ferredoxin protein